MILYWIWLAQLPGITLSQKHILLQYFTGPDDMYHASQERCAAIPGISDTTLAALENKDLTAARKILRDCQLENIQTIAFADSTYPGRLKSIREAPLVLYVKGILPSMEETPSIGVVGTRKATPYGLNAARQFAAEIAACGGIVVSGGAFGNDTQALAGAMDAGGTVIGVLACGLDNPSPQGNAPLFSRIEKRGCLISEYPPKTPAHRWHFPERNRIISGLCNGVLVVEAPKRSGALITAQHAFRQGREVFAVPANIDMVSCAGSNALLQDRGLAASTGWDIMKVYAPRFPDKVKKAEPHFLPEYRENSQEVLAETVKTPVSTPSARVKKEKLPIDKEEKPTYSVIEKPLPTLSPDEQALFSCIRSTPRAVDEVIAEAGIPTQRALSLLTMLSVKGLVISHPGSQVSLK